MSILARAYRVLRYAGVTKSPRQLLELSRYRDIRPDGVAKDRHGCLVICGTDVAVDGGVNQFLLRGFPLVDDLLRRGRGKLSSDAGPGVVLEIGGVRLRLSCWEELFIAHEVFHRGIYNITRRHPFRVVDVGMNTATAALFFAADSRCARVDAFELFPPTLVRARENLDINPHLAGKIVTHGFGLGGKDEALVLDYHPDLKGSLGIAGLPDYARPADLTAPPARVNVEVRAAAPVFERLLGEADAPPVVCKLDCEGSEYGVLRSLADANLLRRIDCLMIEWHLLGAGEIKELLGKNGFVCLSFDEHTGTHGMVYAFRAAA